MSASRHRLTTADYTTDSESNEFEYDLLGNRVSYTRRDTSVVEYAHNAANEYTRIGDPLPGSDNVVHDHAGNLVSDERGFGFAYDYDNRLTTIFTDSGAGGGTAGNGVQDGSEPTVAAYAYDALGRRVRRIDYVTGGTTATTVKYYYDGQNVVAEFDGSTTPVLQRYYIHGATYIDERAVMRDAVNGQDFYYFLRELYTVDGLVNNRGHEVERYLYDAYGKALIVIVNIHDVDYNGTVNTGDRGFVFTDTPPCDNPITDLDANGVINAADKGYISANLGPGLVASKVSGVDNPYLFTGRDLDVYYNGPTDSGDDVDFAVQYNRARYYDAENGRWMGRDPAGYMDGASLYQYIRSAPCRRSDPSGLQSVPAPPGSPNLPIERSRLLGQDAIMEGESDMPVPGSEGDWGNCLGNACRYPVDWNTGNVLWPLSGLEPCSESDFAYMMAFVPRGCKEVACDHPGDASECDCCLGPDPESDGDENIELFVLLSRYKVIRQIESVDARGQRFYQLIRRSRCDFHALGRNPCRDSLWHTKADKRPEYVNVLDPWGNLCDSYPWLCAQEHNTIRARCFCCRSAEMKCSRTQVVDPETGATACELIGRKQ